MFKCVMSQIWLKNFFGKTKEVFQILAIIKMPGQNDAKWNFAGIWLFNVYKIYGKAYMY